jgi:hypothetical protein
MKYYNRRWTPEEEEWLIERYGLVSDRYIRQKLRRSKTAVLLKAKRLGLTKKQNMFTLQSLGKLFKVDSHKVRQWVFDGWLISRRSPWKQGPNAVWIVEAEAVEDFIKQHADKYDRHRINRNDYPFWRNLADEWAFPDEIVLTSVRRGPYSKQGDQYLIDNWHRKDHSVEAICRKLRRLESSVRARTVKLRKLGMPIGRRPEFDRRFRGWTPDAIDYLITHWGLVPDNEVGFVVEKNPRACNAMARTLGITKYSNRKKHGLPTGCRPQGGIYSGKEKNEDKGEQTVAYGRSRRSPALELEAEEAA